MAHEGCSGSGCTHPLVVPALLLLLSIQSKSRWSNAAVDRKSIKVASIVDRSQKIENQNDMTFRFHFNSTNRWSVSIKVELSPICIQLPSCPPRSLAGSNGFLLHELQITHFKAPHFWLRATINRPDVRVTLQPCGVSLW